MDFVKAIKKVEKGYEIYRTSWLTRKAVRGKDISVIGQDELGWHYTSYGISIDGWVCSVSVSTDFSTEDIKAKDWEIFNPIAFFGGPYRIP